MTTVDTRNHKIHSDYGANEYYTNYVKHGGKLTRSQFGKILKDLNLKIAEQILSGYSFKMPSRMGALTVTKKKEIIGIKDGNVFTNRPVDIKATMKLWDECPEAKAEKKLVRFINKHTNGYIYKIAYNRFYATFKNKSAYSIQVNRWLKRGLAKKIFAGFELDELV